MSGKVAKTILLLLCLEDVKCDPNLFSGAFGGVLNVLSHVPGLSELKCYESECCNNKWMSPNFTELASSLRQSVHGQHLAIEPVLKHLEAHSKENPLKALALSFHGGTGTGKTFVSKIVVDNLFNRGMNSKYVHFISVTREYNDEDKVSLYKDKLREQIEKAVAECPRSFFIFDEMDNMPRGLINTLKPYLDYHENLGGVDYRKATFFFLSNTAGDQIMEKTMSSWLSGVGRKSLTLKEMEDLIMRSAYNSDSGLWHSELISKNLITAFVPFLPMERNHVKRCIIDGLVLKGYFKLASEVPERVIQTVADELTYYPDGVGLFSATGCKRVHDKIELTVGGHCDRQNMQTQNQVQCTWEGL